MIAPSVPGLTAVELRQAARAGRWTTPTNGVAAGHVQANLVALPAAHAADFERFCRENPQACPLLEVTDPGAREPRIAPGADLRTDLPRYQVHRDGQLVAEPTDVTDCWTADMVAFLIGCSFSFEHVLMAAGIPLRHISERRNVAMYRTSVPCTPAGPFGGRVVVSMRPLKRSHVATAEALCAAMPQAHGAPIAVGDPAQLGIGDLEHPDFGDAVMIAGDEVPVFWACGVTGIEAIRSAALPLVITHAPGHMFVTDRLV
jgi:uncharacterized protein YcsI (UPF0317 family)